MCTECDKAREFAGYTRHCPSCLWCGARLIQRLGTMQISQSESNRRRRETLAEWMAPPWNHSEVELRRLAKDDEVLPLAPIGQEANTESEPRTQKKRR